MPFTPVPDRDNLFLIPSDRALVNAQHYLASSANCSRVLKKRLQPVMNDFGLIVIDSPPQKNHINLTAIGAADVVIIPAEAVAKGIGSLTETWALLEECREGDAFDGQIIGVLPFRARVVGVQLTGEASESLSAMRSFSGDVVLPAVVESVIYQRAINYGKLPSEVNAAKAELEQPLTYCYSVSVPTFQVWKWRSRRLYQHEQTFCCRSLSQPQPSYRLRHE
jgi:chromosome partitioning protein